MGTGGAALGARHFAVGAFWTLWLGPEWTQGRRQRPGLTPCSVWLEGTGSTGTVWRGPGRTVSPVSPPTSTTVRFSFRQLMAQEPLEKLGFGDLIDGKSETKTEF